MTRLVLIAGASGSGKSRLAHASGCPSLRLDDFYFDADHPGMPCTSLGITDWDDPRSWDAETAIEALRTLLETGQTVVPTYSIGESRRTGSHQLRLDGAPCLTAEGIFAIEFLATCREAGVPAEAIYLDRPALLVFALRLRRDLAHKRKPPLASRRWACAPRRRCCPPGTRWTPHRRSHASRPSVPVTGATPSVRAGRRSPRR